MAGDQELPKVAARRVTRAIVPPLELLLAEQRKTNELLLMLIDALAESDDNPDAEPMTYMDGTPCR